MAQEEPRVSLENIVLENVLTTTGTWVESQYPQVAAFTPLCGADAAVCYRCYGVSQMVCVSQVSLCYWSVYRSGGLLC